MQSNCQGWVKFHWSNLLLLWFLSKVSGGGRYSCVLFKQQIFIFCTLEEMWLFLLCTQHSFSPCKACLELVAITNHDALPGLCCIPLALQPYISLSYVRSEHINISQSCWCPYFHNSSWKNLGGSYFLDPTLLLLMTWLSHLKFVGEGVGSHILISSLLDSALWMLLPLLKPKGTDTNWYYWY